ncbi:hypothetical protein K2173_027137 [Erythroxylum novogranatense]|uniref:DNA-directed RNA polymerase n=1 Tax=Erythroxylum novogranatense TaxID=1862640 RepID=A0AAV8U1N9_9ROSI|nr:hypothetical protein K2173_027137 [Erythroxylum novogranatense]
MPCSDISIEIPIGIFRRNRITKNGDVGVHSIVTKENLIEYQGVKEFKPKYHTKNNSIIGVDTQINLNTRSRVAKLKILSGNIYFSGETDKIFRHSGILISPGIIKTHFKEAKKAKNWIYVQQITPTKKKLFVFVRLVIIYEMADSINLETLFPQDLLQEKDNLKLRVVNYIFCGNGKLIRGISDTSIQLVRTCLAHPSFIEISINGLIRDFLRIHLMKSHISYISRKRNDLSGLGLTSDNGSYRIISILLNINKECQSLIILSSSSFIIVHVDSLVIRSAKPYLATPGATVHGHYGEIVYKGDTLVTFIYEKSRSGDITQGLSKVEQLLEVRSVDSISINLEKRVEGWNEYKTRILGIPWGFVIGAELTIVQSRISLVNKIQKFYRSQGIQIHNRHIEIIVRQITSKVLVLEDEMSNVFSPGELIGLFRAERTGRALEEVISYRAILIGIIRASLNTQSFISEASFQETVRVLAKASLRNRIDWLKGLKENVVLGGMIPVGIGFKGFMHGSREHKNIPLKNKKKRLFEGEMRDILFHHTELFASCISKNFYDTLKQSFGGF